MELSGSRNAETEQLLTDASQLTGVEQELQRTEDGIASLRTSSPTTRTPWASSSPPSRPRWTA